MHQLQRLTSSRSSRLLKSSCYTDCMSLTQDDLADIKQLMQAVMSQGLAEQKREIVTEIRDEMNQRFAEQDEKLDEILNAVGSDLADKSDQLDNHETRITRLEKRAA